jgi:acetamidase/formamidase
MMQRITRDHTVPVRSRYRVLEPVAEVELDHSFVVETINFRTPVIQTPEDANPPVYREREETGPIYVKGIAQGDVLAIHVEDIQPVGHASGGWYNGSRMGRCISLEGSGFRST